MDDHCGNMLGKDELSSELPVEILVEKFSTAPIIRIYQAQISHRKSYLSKPQTPFKIWN